MGPPPLRVLSLCSGGGGLDLGVERALARLGRGVRAVAYVEREAYACAVLAARMAEGALAPAPIWSDLATYEPESCDLVVAGVPCQGNSVAGKRLGRADERWLWPHVERVLAAARPEWFFLENVRGLLSVDRGAAFGEILWSLAGLGFDAEWCVLGARDVGAPHRRDRVFLLAHDQGDRMGRGAAASRRSATAGRLEGRSLLSGDGGAERSAAERAGGVDVADAERDQLRYESGRRGGTLWQGAAVPRNNGPRRLVADADRRRLEGEWRGRLPDGDATCGHDLDGRGGGAAWPPGPDDVAGWRDYLAEHPERAPAIEPTLRRGTDGLASGLGSTRVDELRLLGNGVVPAQAERAFLDLYDRFENNR